MTETLASPGPGPLSLEQAGPVQMGFWVPNRLWATARFLVPLREEVARRRRSGTLTPMHPEVRQLRDWVRRTPAYRMRVTSMVQEANAYVACQDAATRREIAGDGDALWIEDVDALFEIVNEIISTSPGFNATVMVGTPLNGLLAVAMATPSGLALFHDTTFNARFKRVLDAWNAFLKSPSSLDKLDVTDPEKPGSWISKAAWAAGVWDQLEHDAMRPGYGFDSWNAFFTRQFEPGARPFHGDPACVVNVGCETTPWQYVPAVAREADFWIKDVNYSLHDLLGGRDDLARRFEGGPLYQGFLSATHYHRWQAPLDGRIVRSWVEPGTYFAQRPGQPEGAGTWEGTASQPYLGHVATRAVFVLEHDKCGYVALVCIGMVEVSTCVIEPAYLVPEGADPVAVTRGTGIGHFEFGGSTHVMLFEPGRVQLADWAVEAQRHRNDQRPTPLGSVIAVAR